ncbi:hypothetical protein MQX03_02195 [Chryseobacterium aahli]|uniref:hypothetical protein n=1 Tax=Chryseobacterium TaxID=59732 RepID=UPI000F0C1ECB|nr:MULTISPECIES: hypothetical protein [Chryseobacterium]AYN02240.1 hypothetical protein EAG08_19780 [Chryseobacterium sp. 3008163]MCI3935991.1 hypothetical protein [Chryseobacterium aahli]
MKAKYAIFVFLAGFLLNLLGAWLKITHLSFGAMNGNLCLTIGSILQSIGIVLIIFKVLKYPKFKDFLNK